MMEIVRMTLKYFKVFLSHFLSIHCIFLLVNCCEYYDLKKHIILTAEIHNFDDSGDEYSSDEESDDDDSEDDD